MPLKDIEARRAFARARGAERRAADPQAHRDKSARWRANNRELSRNIVRQWRSSNPEKSIYSLAKSRAKRLGIGFSISVEDIVIPEHCPVFGLRLNGLLGRNNSPSLDRIDPTIGYVKGNVWVISDKANRLKSNMTLEEMCTLTKAVASKMGVTCDF